MSDVACCDRSRLPKSVVPNPYTLPSQKWFEVTTDSPSIVIVPGGTTTQILARPGGAGGGAPDNLNDVLTFANGFGVLHTADKWWLNWRGASAQNVLVIDIGSGGFASAMIAIFMLQLAGGVAAIAAYDATQDERLVDKMKTDAFLFALDPGAAAGSRGVRLNAMLFSAVQNTLLTTTFFGLNVNAGVFGVDSSNTFQMFVNKKCNTADGEASNTRNHVHTLAVLFARDTTAGGNGIHQPLEVRANGLGNVGFETAVRGLVTNSRLEHAISKLSATGVAGAAVTLTIPAVASKRAHICSIRISKFAAAALVAAAVPDIVTSTNLSGMNWDTEHRVMGQGETMKDIYDAPTRAIEGDATNTATTIVCPAVADVIWRVTATWFDN